MTAFSHDKRLPVKKKLGKNEAGIRFPQGCKLDTRNRVISLPKIGSVKYRHCQNPECVVDVYL
ncbi:hypothetical protein [Methylomonas sp. AM2-LC]|uniref:hypothetical protein n=1 Tax=Methylomonas sp. AM2-LC TaxID=3153301 RepID=UPI003267E25C